MHKIVKIVLNKNVRALCVKQYPGIQKDVQILIKRKYVLLKSVYSTKNLILNNPYLLSGTYLT